MDWMLKNAASCRYSLAAVETGRGALSLSVYFQVLVVRFMMIYDKDLTDKTSRNISGQRSHLFK